MKRWFILIFFSLFAGPLEKVMAAEPQVPLQVCAAASLTQAVSDAGELFQQNYGVSVSYHFAGSNVLRAQIEKGAPCDVFLSAHPDDVKKLRTQGLIKEEKAFAGNRLVVITAAREDAILLEQLEDLPEHMGEFLSLADPEVVPAGVYAKEALINAGIWGQVKSSVVPAMDVRAALAQVEQGHARYGIVYATDAVMFPKVQIAYEVSEDHHSPIEYWVAVIERPQASPWAEQFYSDLDRPEVQRILEKYGFQKKRLAGESLP